MGGEVKPVGDSGNDRRIVRSRIVLLVVVAAVVVLWVMAGSVPSRCPTCSRAKTPPGWW